MIKIHQRTFLNARNITSTYPKILRYFTLSPLIAAIKQTEAGNNNLFFTLISTYCEQFLFGTVAFTILACRGLTVLFGGNTNIFNESTIKLAWTREP